MAEGLSRVPDPLFGFLQAPRLVQLTTLDAAGAPFVNTLSWVLAHSPAEIRLVGDGRTQFVRNIRADGRVALTVLGAGTAWTVYGQAEALSELSPAGPLRPVLVVVTGLRVFESLFYGAHLTQEPQWEVPSGSDEAQRLDETIFRAMRAFPVDDLPAQREAVRAPGLSFRSNDQ